MRKLRLIPAAVMVVLLAACTKTSITDMTLPGAENVIPGTYRVNYYDDPTGTSGLYDGYTFQFFSNGDLTATDGATSFTGSWIIQATNTSDLYDKEVVMTINGNPDLELLDQPWFVKEVTDVTLQVVDDPATHEIHFIKI